MELISLNGVDGMGGLMKLIANIRMVGMGKEKKANS